MNLFLTVDRYHIRSKGHVPLVSGLLGALSPKPIIAWWWHRLAVCLSLIVQTKGSYRNTVLMTALVAQTKSKHNRHLAQGGPLEHHCGYALKDISRTGLSVVALPQDGLPNAVWLHQLVRLLLPPVVQRWVLVEDLDHCVIQPRQWSQGVV